MQLAAPKDVGGGGVSLKMWDFKNALNPIGLYDT